MMEDRSYPTEAPVDATPALATLLINALEAVREANSVSRRILNSSTPASATSGAGPEMPGITALAFDLRTASREALELVGELQRRLGNAL